MASSSPSLIAIQRNRATVRAAPERRSPWNYPHEFATPDETSAAEA